MRKVGWGSVQPQDFSSYLSLQKPVTKEVIRGCAIYWKRLRAENTPLRVVLNGQLIGVPENFYDALIYHEIVKQPEIFREAMAIGGFLGKYGPGVGDAWVALRIEKMIKAGRLAVVSEAPKELPSYHRVLKKLPTHVEF